jgi:hypothetical protein
MIESPPVWLTKAHGVDVVINLTQCNQSMEFFPVLKGDIESLQISAG